MLSDRIEVKTVQQAAVAHEAVIQCHLKSERLICYPINNNAILQYELTRKPKNLFFSNAMASKNIFVQSYRKPD